MYRFSTFSSACQGRRGLLVGRCPSEISDDSVVYIKVVTVVVSLFGLFDGEIGVGCSKWCEFRLFFSDFEKKNGGCCFY